MKSNVYLEYQEKQVKETDIVAQAKALWKTVGNSAALESLKLYVKPEENTVYCVFNDDVEGTFNI